MSCSPSAALLNLMDEYLRTHDQRFRYPTDTKGKPFYESEDFDIGAYVESMGNFWQSINILVARIEFPERFKDAL